MGSKMLDLFVFIFSAYTFNLNMRSRLLHKPTDMHASFLTEEFKSEEEAEKDRIGVDGNMCCLMGGDLEDDIQDSNLLFRPPRRSSQLKPWRNAQGNNMFKMMNLKGDNKGDASFLTEKPEN